MTGRLLAVEVYYMSGEAVPSIKKTKQSAAALSVLIWRRHAGLNVGEKPLLRVQRISWRTNERQTGRET